MGITKKDLYEDNKEYKKKKKKNSGELKMKININKPTENIMTITRKNSVKRKRNTIKTINKHIQIMPKVITKEIRKK